MPALDTRTLPAFAGNVNATYFQCSRASIASEGMFFLHVLDEIA
ncbi:hypothetical protein ALQ06_200013 [Pseudomonas syringae pv. berberidis]|nr:hypothetical protein ALQ06_200013 [Pseudomonas syringae pv. berberidis]